MESFGNHLYCTVSHRCLFATLTHVAWLPSFCQPLGSSQVVILGEVGDEGDSHTHVDASSNGDG